MEKKPQDTESRHADKFIVRFPDGMRDRLKESAAANQRTMNAEVVARLQASFEERPDTPDEYWELYVEERLAELRIAAIEESLSVQRMYRDAIWARVHFLAANDPEGQRDAALEVAHQVDLQMADLVAEFEKVKARRSLIDMKISSAGRRRLERVDQIADPQIEAELQETIRRQHALWAACQKVGVTKEQIRAAKDAEAKRQVEIAEMQRMHFSSAFRSRADADRNALPNAERSIDFLARNDAGTSHAIELKALVDELSKEPPNQPLGRALREVHGLGDGNDVPPPPPSSAPRKRPPKKA